MLLAGCGYQPVRYAKTTEGLPERTVAVETLRNDSFEPGVEILLSNALRQQFLRRGGLRLVNDPLAADLVVSGSVQHVSTLPTTFSAVILALQYDVTVSLTLQVKRRSGEVVRLDRGTVTNTEIYLASADIEVLRKNRDEALRRGADVLAERVHDVIDLQLFP